jgi:hypothetical protein
LQAWTPERVAQLRGFHHAKSHCARRSRIHEFNRLPRRGKNGAGKTREQQTRQRLTGESIHIQLDVIARHPLPCRLYGTASCDPSRGKVRDSVQVRMCDHDLFHCNYARILLLVRGAASKCPRMVVRVVCDAQDRRAAVKHLAGRYGHSVAGLVEQPCFSHQD